MQTENGSWTTSPPGELPVRYGLAVSIIVLFLVMIVMLISVAGNLTVLLAICRFRSLRTLTNAFVASLSVTDLLVAVLVMPVGAYQLMAGLRWQLGQTACVLATCFDVWLCTSSILHLCCVACDRYTAICTPFKYPSIITKKSVVCLLFACWTMPTLMSFLPLTQNWHVVGIEEKVKEKTPNHGEACVFLVNKVYAVICSTLAFYAPAVFMGLLNARIFVVAQKQARAIRSTCVGSDTRRQKLRRETRAARTLSIIMSVFCACWCPFFILNVLDPFLDYTIDSGLWQTALWLGYANSAVSPFLYYFFNRSYRRAFRALFRFFGSKFCPFLRIRGGQFGHDHTLVTHYSGSQNSNEHNFIQLYRNS